MPTPEADIRLECLKLVVEKFGLSEVVRGYAVHLADEFASFVIDHQVVRRVNVVETPTGHLVTLKGVEPRGEFEK